MKRFFRTQLGFVLWGLAFWLPIAIVILVFAYLFSYVEDAGRKALLLVVPARYLYNGFGFVLGVLILYISGMIFKLTKIRTRLSKIPILGLAFGGGEVITVERLSNLMPCLFMMSPTCLSYGWVLSEERVTVGREAAGFTIVNVYYPNVPTLITGQVFPVRKDTIVRLGNPSKEIIDLLLYAFRSPESLIYLPWDYETPERFRTRAARFGINWGPEETKGRPDHDA
jgi:hypothetical protein